METIKNRFLYYKKRDNFMQDYDLGKIEDTSIVFIEDSNSIWTHKHEYTCSNSNTSQEQQDSSEYLKKSEIQDYFVTITTAQYLRLVDTNQVLNDVYYFTYEGDQESIEWHFGESFPIIFKDTWEFGGTFPIKLV